MFWKATLRLMYHLSFFVPVEWCCVAPVSSGICVNRSRTMRMIKCILTFPLVRMATVTTGKDWRNYVTDILPLFIKINFELINILCIHSSVPAVQGRPKKKLEGFVWSFLSITGLRSQRQFAPKCSFLASRSLGHCSFRISWQIP